MNSSDRSSWSPDSELPDSEFDPECAMDAGEAVDVFRWLSDLSDCLAQGSVAATAFDVARTVGRFNVEALLGTGAYGAVFRAYDTKLGRAVALKLAWPAVTFNTAASRRFAEESQTAAGLDHPGIVQVHDAGHLNFVQFISFALIDGPTLAQWVEEQVRIPIRLAVEIMLAVAEAVDFVHQDNVVHRDLKPSNVLLRRGHGPIKGFPYRPLVTDFGLARHSQPERTSGHTATVAVVGTDHYMSPEQASARAATVGPPSDVFSLGIMLYELLAGRRPFESEYADEIRAQILEHDPPPLRALRKQVPRDLNVIVAKCLEKSPERRYASAGELTEDLRRFLAHEPILAKRTSLGRRVWKLARRRPIASLSTAAGLIAALALAAGWNTVTTERETAAQRVEAAEAAAAVADVQDRQQRYVSSIRRAGDAWRRGGHADITIALDEAQRTVGAGVRRGVACDLLLDFVDNATSRSFDADLGRVREVCFCRVKDLLASQGDEGAIAIWETTNWNRLATLGGQDQAATTISFSADGKWFARGMADGRLLIHRVEDQVDLTTSCEVRLFDGPVHALCWLDGSSHIVAGGTAGQIASVDTTSWQIQHRIDLPISRLRRQLDGFRNAGRIHRLLPCRSGQWLIVGTESLALHVVQTPSLDVLRTWDVSEGVRDFCILSESPPLLASCGNGLLISIWNYETGTLVSESAISSRVQRLQYSRQDDTVAAAMINGVVELLDAPALVSGRSLVERRLFGHDGIVLAIDRTQDGRCLVGGGYDGRIHVWEDPAASKVDLALPEHASISLFSPCGRYLAVVCFDLEAIDAQANLGVAFPAEYPPALVTLYDVGSMQSLWSLEARPGLLHEIYRVLWPITFTATGDRVVFRGLSGQFCEYESKTGREILQYPPGPMSHVVQVVKPRGVPVTVLRGDVERTSSGERLPPRERRPVTAVVDETTGAVLEEHENAWPRRSLGLFETAMGNSWIDLIDPAVPRVEADLSLFPHIELDRPADTVWSAAVSPDGLTIAGGGGHDIFVWDVHDRAVAFKLRGHEAMVINLQFSPDGGTLLSRSIDGVVRFWNVATREELLSLGSSEQPITCVGLSPDGRRLALGVSGPDRTFGLKIHHLNID